MGEFFGFGGYTREAEGFMSWQHLTFVTILMVIMIGVSVFLGIKNRNKEFSSKNKVLIWSAFLIDGFEIFKIMLVCIRGKDPVGWLYELPLFLCSIQLITIPLAAFCKGRIKEASLDFVMIFGEDFNKKHFIESCQDYKKKLEGVNVYDMQDLIDKIKRSKTSIKIDSYELESLIYPMLYGKIC